MRVGVPRETAPNERRVALVPEVIQRLAGFQVAVERGAGAQAGFEDAAYAEAGAELVEDAWRGVEAVVKVAKPAPAEAERLASGQLLIAFLAPLADREGVERLARRGVLGFAMESIPRTTRAQAMDALSSQATVAGYKAVLLAAARLPRFFPMLTTAAGTIAPARALVLGAGVAGLQAIAAARRGRRRLRRPPGRPRAGGVARRELPRPRRRRRGDGRRLRPRARPGGAGPPAARARGADPRLRRRDHDRGGARPARAAPDPGDGGRADASRLGDRRPRRGDRGQLRADGARRGARGARGDDRGDAEPAEHDGDPREPALRAERRLAARAPRPQGRALPRLERRDHRRDLRHAATGERRAGGMSHYATLVVELTILVLAIFLGVEVISKVPTLLHTPLMSGTNAIHGIVIVGAMLVAGAASPDLLTGWVGFVAMVLAAGNVVGGFVVTDRMLEMFKRREPPRREER